jgi:hypothetical protein
MDHTVSEANRYELDRRRRDDLHRSLQNPHVESGELAGQGFEEWAQGLPEEDTEALLNVSTGKAVQWIPGEGWVQGRE